MSTVKKLAEVEKGKIFKIGECELINFPETEGTSIVVFKNTVFHSTFGKNNNFKTSTILEKLNNEILPEIEAAVGADNICDVVTDLTTLDGLKTYGEMTSKISLPTVDFYRENVEIFDKHKLGEWWWLATPDSAEPHYKNCPWITCVSPLGDLFNGRYDCDYGVRPFLRFKSSILVSCED